MPTGAPEESEPVRAHDARRVAESFGSDADLYDRTRPRYPAPLVARIVDAAPGRDILDVGCGTGIAARQFRAAGCRVLGVEPDQRMAEFARRTGVAVEVSTFESWEPAGRAFDAVVAGQAWHWVDPVAGAVKAGQVLRPGGRAAVFWYVFEPPSELQAAFSAVYRRVVPDSPFSRGTTPGLEGYAPFFTRAADGLHQAGSFGEAEQWRFDWDHSYARDEWLDQVPTFGGHNQFPRAQLDQLLEGIGAAIDVVGGSFTMHSIAVVVTAQRVAAP
jgi:SAM-dependent methyltransferase